MSKCNSCMTRRSPCFSNEKFRLEVQRTGICEYYQLDDSLLDQLLETEASLEPEAAGLPASRVTNN